MSSVAPTGQRRTAPRRWALLLVLAGLVLLASGGLASGGLAAQAVAAPGGSDADRPVRIDLTAMEPAVLVPGGTVVLTYTLTNTGAEPLSSLQIRLQRGDPVTTRAQLEALDPASEPAAALAAFQPVSGTLTPGASLTTTYTTSAADLGISQDGVYPALLNLNATGPDSTARRVGELNTYLVQETPRDLTTVGGSAPQPTTSVTWLWPLVEPSHRDALGSFTDDGLAGEIASGGRLDRVLATLERLAAGTSSLVPGTQPVLPVLVVDPALLEELGVMADGPYAVAGRDGAGTGTAAAVKFLDRLRAVAQIDPVVALGYGDVDVDALATGGLTTVAARSLPGSAAIPAPPAEGSDPTAPADAASRIVLDVLGVTPRTDIAWSESGSLHSQTTGLLSQNGIHHVVVGSTGLVDGAAAAGLDLRADGSGATARTPLPDGLDGLVADAGLSGLADSAEDEAAGGVRVAAQRYLAELALLARQPSGDPAAPRAVLVAPSRTLDPDPERMAAFISLTSAVPGVRLAPLSDLLAGPAVDTGGLMPPTESAGLDAFASSELRQAVAVRDELAAAVVGDPAVVLAGFDMAIARATSVSVLDDVSTARTSASALRAALTPLLDEVTLLSPADGTYSLASTDAPLVLTVQNDLPFAVRVQLNVRARNGVGLSVGDIGTQELAPGQRTVLKVPAEVSQSGRFSVTARLTTPSGASLGNEIDLQVTSTAYGTLSLAITFGAAGLLALLFLRRLVLFLRRRRARRAEADEPVGAPEGAAVPRPPARSPV